MSHKPFHRANVSKKSTVKSKSTIKKEADAKKRKEADERRDRKIEEAKLKQKQKASTHTAKDKVRRSKEK